MTAAAAFVVGALLVVVWFARPAFLPGPLPLAVVLVMMAALLARRSGPLRLPSVHAETWLCLAVALLYRLPALVHPWAWVNRDGAYGAFVALHLLQGVSPAPVFTEGANYQGTLKPHLAALLALVTRARDLSWLMAAGRGQV